MKITRIDDNLSNNNTSFQGTMKKSGFDELRVALNRIREEMALMQDSVVMKRGCRGKRSPKV